MVIDSQLINVRAAVDIDVSGDGRAAAYDGENSIATEGDNFCSITNDIAGGRFSTLFEGIVNCDDNTQEPNQFAIEYSYTQNPVKVGEKTYLTITVKDRSTGSPISDAHVKLAIEPRSPLFETSTFGKALAAAAAAAAATSTQAEEKIGQDMYTDRNGVVMFTLQVEPESESGIYDTEIEIEKDNYQSSFEKIELQVL